MSEPTIVYGERELLPSINLLFQGVSIQVISDQLLSVNSFQDHEKNVTGMEYVSSDTRSDNPSGTLIYLANKEVSINYSEEEKTLTLKGPLSYFGDGTAISHTAHYMAECMRASESGILVVHSAAVSDPDNETAIVLFGEKGAGKTTLALRLCHQFGFELIGNDQVYLGTNDEKKIITCGGNPYFMVRQTAAVTDDYIGQLLKINTLNGRPSWNNKLRVDPKEIGVKTVQNRRIPAKSLFHVRIDHTQNGLQAQKWTGLQRNLVLHERVGRHVSGQATPLLTDNGDYLGSLPPINQQRAIIARDQLVKSLIRKGIIEIFAPNSDAALDYITDTHSK